MKLSEVIQEVEDWLVWFTYNFEITGCEQCFNGDYRVRFVEYRLSGESSDEETFTVTQSGKLINSNGDDVTEIQLDNSDPDCVQWIRDFKEQWYKEEYTSISEEKFEKIKQKVIDMKFSGWEIYKIVACIYDLFQEYIISETQETILYNLADPKERFNNCSDYWRDMDYENPLMEIVR